MLVVFYPTLILSNCPKLFQAILSTRAAVEILGRLMVMIKIKIKTQPKKLLKDEEKQQ